MALDPVICKTSSPVYQDLYDRLILNANLSSAMMIMVGASYSGYVVTLGWISNGMHDYLSSILHGISLTHPFTSPSPSTSQACRRSRWHQCPQQRMPDLLSIPLSKYVPMFQRHHFALYHSSYKYCITLTLHNSQWCTPLHRSHVCQLRHIRDVHRRCHNLAIRARKTQQATRPGCYYWSGW